MSRSFMFKLPIFCWYIVNNQSKRWTMKWYGVLKWLLFHLMLFQIAWYNLFLTFKLALCNLVRLFWKYSSEGYRPCVDLRRNFSKPKLPANCRLLAVFYKYDVIIGRFVYWQYASHCQIAGNLLAGFGKFHLRSYFF